MSKLISRNNNIVKYEESDQKIDRNETTSAVGNTLVSLSHRRKVNKFEDGNQIRKYQWLKMPQTDSQYTDYETNQPIQPGQKVLADEEGNLITADTPWAKQDYMLLTGREPNINLDLPPVNIEITKEGNTDRYSGESFADRYTRLSNAPIARSADLDKVFEELAQHLVDLEIQKELQRRRNEQFSKDVDTVFVKAPLALLALGITGAATAPYWLPGTIGGNIIGTTAFGEALSHAIKYGTGKTMGEHLVNAAHYLGIPLNKWGNFGILMIGDTPVYLMGDVFGKAITTAGRTLGKEALELIALDNTLKSTVSTKDLTISRILLLDDMVKIAATSKATPERLRLWKGLMYLTNGRPSEGIKQAAKRLSSDELVYLMQYVRTGDTSALAKLKPGYMGFIRRMFKPKSWLERYTSTIDPTKIDLLDLTLQIQNSIVDVPKLYTQLAKSSAILPKSETIDILGGEIIGNKSAITNPYVLDLLAGENVPKGFTPIVTDKYINGVNAIKRLNTETPIMRYSLQTHQIKSGKPGEEGMFNTTGMHNFIYRDSKTGKLKLVEVDVFKNTIGGIKQKYAGVEDEATSLYGKMVSRGKLHMFERFNQAEQSPVLIVKLKNLEASDILNALAMQEKRIYLGRASLEAGQITQEQFAAIQKEVQLTEARLLEILTDMNPEYYLTKLTEVDHQSRKLLGKPDVNGHFRDKSDIHIESTINKIILTQGSRKIPQTVIPEDRERIDEILRSAIKYGKEKATLHGAIRKSLVETPETLSPMYKSYYKTVNPEGYSKAIKLHDIEKFAESPQDNITVLFNYGITYNPQTLIPRADKKLNNTLYIILRYDLKDPNMRLKVDEMIEKGYTLFDPQKMRDPDVFYNTIRECKEQYAKKLQDIIPFVDSKIKPYLIKSQLNTVILPKTLKSGGRLTPRKFQFGGIPKLSDITLPDLIVYAGNVGSDGKFNTTQRIYNETLSALKEHPITQTWDNIRLSNLAKYMTAHKIAENGWVYGKGGPWAGYGKATTAKEFVNGMFKNYLKSVNSNSYEDYVKNLNSGKYKYNSVNPNYVSDLITKFGINSRVWKYLNSI